MIRIVAILVATVALAQSAPQPDWNRADADLLQHFQALVRFDTADPPGRELEATDYLKKVLEGAGIPTQTFALNRFLRFYWDAVVRLARS